MSLSRHYWTIGIYEKPELFHYCKYKKYSPSDQHSGPKNPKLADLIFVYRLKFVKKAAEYN